MLFLVNSLNSTVAWAVVRGTQWNSAGPPAADDGCLGTPENAPVSLCDSESLRTEGERNSLKFAYGTTEGLWGKSNLSDHVIAKSAACH